MVSESKQLKLVISIATYEFLTCICQKVNVTLSSFLQCLRKTSSENQLRIHCGALLRINISELRQFYNFY